MIRPRPYEKTHSGARLEGIVVLDHKLIVGVGVHKHLIMDTLEGAALHDSSELGSFELVHDVDVLRTHNHIDRHILTEALVHALEIMSDEGSSYR